MKSTIHSRSALILVLLALSGQLYYAHGQGAPPPTPFPIPTPSQGENLSLTAVSAVASHSDGEGSGPQCVKDGSFLTRWESTPGYGQTLEMDLGRLCLSDAMVMIHPSIWTGNPVEDLLSYEIEISIRAEEEDDWELAFSVVNSGSEAYNILTLDPPRELRYARLTVGAPSKDPDVSITAKVVEWQIWGEELEPLPEPDSEPVEQTPGEIAALQRFREGEALMHANSHAEAKQVFLEVLNDPEAHRYTQAWALVNLAGMAEDQWRDREQAMGYLDQIIGEYSDVADPMAFALYRKGKMIINDARLAEAEDLFCTVISQYPNDINAVYARIGLIDVYKYMKTPWKALQAYEEIMGLPEERVTDEQRGWAATCLVGVSTDGQGVPTETKLERYREVWRDHLDAGAPAAHAKNQIGYTLYSQGQYAEAIDEFEEMLGVYSGLGNWSAFARFFMAECWRKLGDDGVAEGIYEEMLTKDAGTTWRNAAELALQAIEWKRGTPGEQGGGN